MTIHILLSSAGAKVPLLQALRQAGLKTSLTVRITAGDCDDNVVSRYIADAFWHMPRLEDTTVDNIRQQLQQRQITHVLPSRDGELLFWANCKEALVGYGIHVMVASPRSISLCLDKKAFATAAIPFCPDVIPCLPVPDINDQQLWVVKEQFGSGSSSLGLALTADQAINHSQTLLHPVFQPYIPGQEISIDAWLDHNSRLKGHIYRYRQKVQHGESQITTTVALPQYDAQVKRLLEGLELSGPVVVQGNIATDGRLRIIECNSRFGGASTLGIKAGVDSLYWSLAQSLGENTDNIPFLPATPPLTQIRFAQDLYL